MSAGLQAAVAPHPGLPLGAGAAGPLTRVRLLRIAGKLDVRLRFGRPLRIVRLAPHRRVALFVPSAVFCRIQRELDGERVTRSDLLILMASAAQTGIKIVDGITPGVHVLAHASGEVPVNLVLQQIGVIGAQGIDPAAVAPAYWRTLHNRLSAGMALPDYSPERHAGYLANRVVR
jgi:hypothetical protein